MEHLAQILLLLTLAVTVVVTFQRLQIPTSLGYLLVGVILSPHTVGPTIYISQFDALAEFGVVFLLFTIGLNFSLPQLHALRHQVLGLGTGQVVLTTLVVTLVLWLGGLPAAPAFVFGAVFAQSSTTIIASLLAEIGEDNSRHGRLGLAMSVFQDVTAVPFIVVIPTLAAAAGAGALATALGWAMGKAAIAFGLVFFAGRWLFRPLFHRVAERRSSEVFTLAVLLVALLAAWTTNRFGLSLAFGGFLAGMMLGETEFRHQVESSIRPFRDVLLGMFFVGIGMRFDPLATLPILHWAVLGALLIVLSKTVIVALIVRGTGIDLRLALRTGLLLSVGGEFGFALIVIAQDAAVLDARLIQVAMSSVLLSMLLGAALIRFNHAIATRFVGSVEPAAPDELPAVVDRLVLIAGYGRVGHAIAVLLQASGVPFVAFDTNPQRIAQGIADGHAVSYGDLSDPALLASIHPERASLVVVTVDASAAALRIVSQLKHLCPEVPVVARARDLEASSRLLAAGALHAYPDAVEASLRLGALALDVLRIPNDDINSVIQDVRDRNYTPILERPME